MVPGLERIPAVSVQDHVLRKVLQAEGDVRIGGKGLTDIFFQQIHPFFHPDAQFPGGRGRVRMRLPGEQRGRQQHQGDGHDRHPDPKPYAGLLTHGDKALPG